MNAWRGLTSSANATMCHWRRQPSSFLLAILASPRLCQAPSVPLRSSQCRLHRFDNPAIPVGRAQGGKIVSRRCARPDHPGDMTMKSSGARRFACLEITLCEEKTSEINLLNALRNRAATTPTPAGSWPRNSRRQRIPKKESLD